MLLVSSAHQLGELSSHVARHANFLDCYQCWLALFVRRVASRGRVVMDDAERLSYDLVLDEVMSGEAVTENGAAVGEYDFLIKFLALG